MTTLNLATLPTYITNVLKAVKKGVIQAQQEEVGCNYPDKVHFKIEQNLIAEDDEYREIEFDVPVVNEERYLREMLRKDRKDKRWTQKRH